MNQSRRDREPALQPARRPGLDRADFDALYERWFPRAIGWLNSQGCIGRDAEIISGVALEAFFGEIARGASRDELSLAQRLMTHLRRTHSLFARRSIQGGARVSGRTLSLAASANR